MDEEKISISFKDLYCIARLLQSALILKGNPYGGCQYCKYNCAIKDDPAPNADRIRERLHDMTGVCVMYGYVDDTTLEKENSRCGDSDF